MAITNTLDFGSSRNESVFTTNPDDENIAHACKVFDDARMSEDGLPLLEGEDAFDGSGSLRSCVNNMTTWCKVLIQAIRAEPSMNESSGQAAPPSVASESSHGLTRDAVLKAQLLSLNLFLPRTCDKPMASVSSFFHLPTSEINTITNGHAPQIMNSYTLGADSFPMAVVGHIGNLGSFTNAYWTFPETESAVIVATNASSTYGDPSNVVAQVLIQARFEMQPAIDYEKLASGVVAKAKARWQEILDAWSAERKIGTQPRELTAYVGAYESTDLRMTLEINAVGEGSLRLCINGLPKQEFDLYHYHLDTWPFLPKSHDECLELGMGYYLLSWESFNVSFDRLDGILGPLRGLIWQLDLDPRADP